MTEGKFLHVVARQIKKLWRKELQAVIYGNLSRVWCCGCRPGFCMGSSACEGRPCVLALRGQGEQLRPELWLGGHWQWSSVTCDCWNVLCIISHCVEDISWVYKAGGRQGGAGCCLLTGVSCRTVPQGASDQGSGPGNTFQLFEPLAASLDLFPFWLFFGKGITSQSHRGRGGARRCVWSLSCFWGGWVRYKVIFAWLSFYAILTSMPWAFAAAHLESSRMSSRLLQGTHLSKSTSDSPSSL